MVSWPRFNIQTCIATMALLVCALLLLACGSNGGDAEPPATFSLKGTITPPVYSAVDSDVNDPNAPWDETDSPNDSPTQAQEILNPVILAGYVNLPGQGPPGRSFANGDPQDFFQAYLLAGDSIVLAIARANLADLDLYLYRADDLTLVDAALGTGAIESLTAPEDGSYLIAVQFHDSNQTADGASTYNLIIGSDMGTSDSASLRLSDDFVAGEVVIRYADPPSPSNRTLLDADPAPLFDMTPVGGDVHREMRMTFGPGEQTRSVFAALNLRPAVSAKSLDAAITGTLQHKLETLKVIKALRKRADVRSAAPNLKRHLYALPNDDYFELQWHYDSIHLPEAWDIYTGSSDVVVAVVDTGVLVDHPDLSDRLTEGYDFISDFEIEGNELPHERGGIDPNPDDPGDQSSGGSSFHGTHVAGIIAAHTNNAVGVAGVGWDAARIMPLRVIGVGGGVSWDIIQAVRYAAGLPNDSGTVPERPADIINLSLGSDVYSEVEEAIFQEVIAKGVIVVAAAGNAASSEPSYPAAYNGVISVSAVDYVSSPTYYSNFGPQIDVAAPGGDNTVDLNRDGYPDGVWSTMGNDASGQIEMVYRPLQGTSMAAPHVAGVAGLMKGLWPAMDANAFTGLLIGGAITDDLGQPGWDDRYGHGMINAHKALLAVLDDSVPPLLHVSPSAIGFGPVRTQAAILLEKVGDEDALLTVRSTSADVDWLTVSPERIDESGLGTYGVTVDRTGLANGTYNGTLTFVSSENTVTLTVSMLVGQTDRTADAGYHYVLLLDPITLENRKQVGATLGDGVYHFSFANIAGGDYLVYTGSDLDNNLVIGEVGESFGAYLSIAQPVVIHVDKDIDDLEFKTVFHLNLPNASQHGHAPQHRSLDRTSPIRIDG